jgi:hypothetical protein
VGGLLLALGLFTRPLPFVLAGDMGGRLFYGPCAERCLPAAQRRGVGDRPLVRLSLSLGRRRGRMEPRSTARARIRIRRIAEPRLSNRHTLAGGWGRARRSTNLPLLPPRDRHQPQADRSGQPLREAVLSWRRLSPLPRSVGLGQLSAGNRPPVAAGSLHPKPQEAPHPIPSRSALWLRRGLRLWAFTRTLSYRFAAAHLVLAGHAFVPNCRSPFRCRGVGPGIGELRPSRPGPARPDVGIQTRHDQRHPGRRGVGKGNRRAPQKCWVSAGTHPCCLREHAFCRQSHPASGLSWAASAGSAAPAALSSLEVATGREARDRQGPPGGFYPRG